MIEEYFNVLNRYKLWEFKSKSDIVKFFQDENFRVLKKFKKSKSLFLIKNLNIISKFLNLIQKKGLKVRYKNLLVRSFNLPFFKKYGFKDQFSLVISSIFTLFNPIFSYTITKIGKQQRKNSRTKGDSYFFLWKYTPKYKRFKIFLKIFSKEVKYTKEIKFINKLKVIFNNLYLNYKTFLQQYVIFVSRYVFKNLRYKVYTKRLTSK